jgi:hypothetical protein
MMKSSRLTTTLMAAPLVIAAPIAAFILWDSLGHWKTTSLTFCEYYYLPLAIFRSYLLIAYGIELVLVLPVVLLWRARNRKNGNESPNQALHATSEPAPDAASSSHEG